jgi:hypothetical protein
MEFNIIFCMLLHQVQFEITIAEDVEAVVCCEATISGEFEKE